LAVTIDAQLSKLSRRGSASGKRTSLRRALPIPTGNPQRVEKLLDEMNIAVDFDLGEDGLAIRCNGLLSLRAIRRRNSGRGSPKRLPADFVIASHALLQADRLMTRDASRYRQDFPTLRLI